MIKIAIATVLLLVTGRIVLSPDQHSIWVFNSVPVLCVLAVVLAWSGYRAIFTK